MHVEARKATYVSVWTICRTNNREHSIILAAQDWDFPGNE